MMKLLRLPEFIIYMAVGMFHDKFEFKISHEIHCKIISSKYLYNLMIKLYKSGYTVTL